MSAATSPGTGLAYGLRRVCAAWGTGQISSYVGFVVGLIAVRHFRG